MTVKFSKKDLKKLYTNLVRARAYNDLCVKMLTEGKFVSFYHETGWSESAAVGSTSFLKKDDIIYPHLRGHGIPYIIGKGIDPKSYLAEHCGRDTGCCSGIGSIHMSFEEDGVYSQTGILGSGFSLSVGWGIGAKKNNRQQVVVSNFGDGTVNRGQWHEAGNLSQLWKLPIVWVCENNGMAQYVSTKNSYPQKDLADLALAYGMKSAIVDGQDVVAVAEAVGEAVARARKGEGPTFIECKTIRVSTHGYGNPHYLDGGMRDPKSIEEAKKREPIALFEKKLLAGKVLTKKDMEKIKKAAEAETAETDKFCMESQFAGDPSILDDFLYAK